MNGRRGKYGEGGQQATKYLGWLTDAVTAHRTGEGYLQLVVVKGQVTDRLSIVKAVATIHSTF